MKAGPENRWVAAHRWTSMQKLCVLAAMPLLATACSNAAGSDDAAFGSEERGVSKAGGVGGSGAKKSDASNGHSGTAGQDTGDSGKGGSDKGVSGGGGASGDDGTGGGGVSGAGGEGASGDGGSSSNGDGGSGVYGNGGNGTGGAGNSGSGGSGSTGDMTSLCTGPGLEIITLLNSYRAGLGLSNIPCAPSLMIVADTHVHDLYEHHPDTGANCNAHSWSNQGPWTGCCYTPDHAQAQCMWDKPRELSDYLGNGYECAATGVTSPSQAMAGWKGSPPHNAVMTNQGSWASVTFRGVGAALYNGYAALWFGEMTDP